MDTGNNKQNSKIESQKGSPKIGSQVRAFKPRKRGLLNYLFPIILIIALVGSSFYRFLSTEEIEEVGISQLYSDAREGIVEEFVVCEGRVEEKLKDSDVKRVATKGEGDFAEFLYSQDGLGLSESEVPVRYCEPPLD